MAAGAAAIVARIHRSARNPNNNDVYRCRHAGALAQRAQVNSDVLFASSRRFFEHHFDTDAAHAVPIHVITPATVDAFLAQQSPEVRAWLEANDFDASARRNGSSSGGSYAANGGGAGANSHEARIVLVPSFRSNGDAHAGALAAVVIALAEDEPPAMPWALASAPTRLPRARKYQYAQLPSSVSPSAAALAWALGTYDFSVFYKRARAQRTHCAPARAGTLVWPAGCDVAHVEAQARAAFFTRDLINTPAEDMGPAALERCARALALEHGVECRVVAGDALLEENFPQVHAVGRAAAARHAPRLIEISSSSSSSTTAATAAGAAGGGGASTDGAPSSALPEIVLVGKGVTFDSGGLDIKPASGMRLMKKDMGGAANVLGLAHLILSDAQLRRSTRLRVLIPAVENDIGGGAFRPGDILRARNGITTEVGNTDAEGRLVLADALAYAVESQPALVIDCATLTGAGRVALGTELPAMFCNDERVASELTAASTRTHDLVWRLPLYAPYRAQLASKVADIQNVSSGSSYAGCITAALYLREFLGGGRQRQRRGNGEEDAERAAVVSPPPPWVHLDFMAYATSSSPGRPEGGLEQGIRALYSMLRQRYAGGDGGGEAAS